MALTPACDFCKNELNDFGGLVFSPPDEQSEVKKLHICRDCYQKIIQEQIK